MPDHAHRHDHEGGAHSHAPGQAHAHGHAHGHAHAPSHFGPAFAIGITLNVAYVAGEIVAGSVSHSLALLADAGHNGGDVLGLTAAWLASRLGRARPTARFTYGFRSSSILAALANAVMLLVVTGAIAAEAIRRFLRPAPVAGMTVIEVAAVGIVVNVATALLFLRGRSSDLNVRAAFAHMAGDAIVAAGVVVAGGAILLTGWSAIDPLTSLLVSGVIVAGTWSILRDSLAYALDAVPPGIDRDAVARLLENVPGVTAVHDLHIWGMSTTETALTAHLVRPGQATDDAMLSALAERLRVEHGIGHATLQVEAGDAGFPCVLAPHDVV